MGQKLTATLIGRAFRRLPEHTEEAPVTSVLVLRGANVLTEWQLVVEGQFKVLMTPRSSLPLTAVYKWPCRVAVLLNLISIESVI